MTAFSQSIQRQNPQDQLDLFSALEKVEEAANQEWWNAATARVRYLCETRVEFTTDLVWSHLDALECSTKEPRALGAIMQNAAKAGWCVSSGVFVKSTRPECHSRPIVKWQSRLLS
ncbi:MAG: hypothetical protein JWP89_2585 [Schlesneria sp.]|nr:hypothetical protein [Schlesneria sp.]